MDEMYQPSHENKHCNKCKHNTSHKRTGTRKNYVCKKHGDAACKDSFCRANYDFQNASEWNLHLEKKYACVICIDNFVKRGLARLERINNMKCNKCGKQGHEFTLLNDDETEMICGDCFVCDICKSPINLKEVGGYAKYREPGLHLVAHNKCYQTEFGDWKWGGSNKASNPPLFVSTETRFKTPKDAAKALADVLCTDNGL
jgi:hypothetical protein